jgi:hypothetical protein
MEDAMKYRAIMLFAAFFLTFAAHSAPAEREGFTAPPAASWRLAAGGVQSHRKFSRRAGRCSLGLTDEKR